MTREQPVEINEPVQAQEVQDFEMATRNSTAPESEVASRIEERAIDPEVDNESLFQTIFNGEIFKNDAKITDIKNEAVIDAEFRVIEESRDPKPAKTEKEPPEHNEEDPITVAKKYVSKAVAKDPLYQQKLGEVVQEKTEKGQKIDPYAVQKEATQRYMDAKTVEFAKMSSQDQIESIKTEYADLLAKHEQLKLQLEATQIVIRKQAEALESMSRALLELAQKIREAEEDEEEQISLIELLVKLMVWIMQEMVKTEEENKQAQAKQEEEDRKPKIKKGVSNEDLAQIKDIFVQQEQLKTEVKPDKKDQEIPLAA